MPPLAGEPGATSAAVFPSCFSPPFLRHPFGLANSHVVSVHVRDADLDGSFGRGEPYPVPCR